MASAPTAPKGSGGVETGGRTGKKEPITGIVKSGADPCAQVTPTAGGLK